MVLNSCRQPIFRPERSHGRVLGAVGNDVVLSVQLNCASVGHGGMGLEEGETRGGGCKTAAGGGAAVVFVPFFCSCSCLSLKVVVGSEKALFQACCGWLGCMGSGWGMGNELWCQQVSMALLVMQQGCGTQVASKLLASAISVVSRVAWACSVVVLVGLGVCSIVYELLSVVQSGVEQRIPLLLMNTSIVMWQWDRVVHCGPPNA